MVIIGLKIILKTKKYRKYFHNLKNQILINLKLYRIRKGQA